MNPFHAPGTIPVIGDRLAAVNIPPQALQAFLTPDGIALFCTQGLPADAELRNVGVLPDGRVQLLFRHESFPLPMANGMVAEVPVQITGIPVQVQQAPAAEEATPAPVPFRGRLD